MPLKILSSILFYKPCCLTLWCHEKTDPRSELVSLRFVLQEFFQLTTFVVEEFLYDREHFLHIIDDNRRRHPGRNLSTNFKLDNILHIKGGGTGRYQRSAKQVAPRSSRSWTWGKKVVVSIFHLRSPNNARSIFKIINTANSQLFSSIDSKVGFRYAMTNSHPATVPIVETHGHIRHVQVINCIRFVNIVNLCIPFFSVFQVHNEIGKGFSITRSLHTRAKSQ